MPLFQIQVGPMGKQSDGTFPDVRGINDGSLGVSEVRAKHAEQTYRGVMYSACNQAAVTTGAGLSATVATISLSNDPGSGVNLEVVDAGWVFSAAPAAACLVYLVGGFTASTAVTHTTPITVRKNILAASANAYGKADSAATLPAAPVALYPMTSAVAASSITPAPGYLYLDGKLLIPPGGYIAIQASSAGVGFGAFTWYEYPI